MVKKFVCQVVLLVCLIAASSHASLENLPSRSHAQFPAAHPMAQFAPTPNPLSNVQRVLSHVSQTARVPIERLRLADTFAQAFSLTGHTLWRGVILDQAGDARPFYEVIVQAQDGRILSSSQVEAVWDAERTAYHARYGVQVLEQIAQQERVAVTRLQISNDVLEIYPLTGAIFWRIVVLDVETGVLHHYALGPDGVEVDPAALRRAEFEAHRARYGRLDTELYYRLQVLGPDELVPVLLWVRGVDYEWVDVELSRRYPELAAEYRFAGGHLIHENGSPVHLPRVLFERIHAGYNDLLDQAHLTAAQPVVDLLASRGYGARPIELFPGVYAELPKSAVVELSEASGENLGAIYWGTIEIREELDSTAATTRASDVWNSTLCDGGGCTGAGVTIAIAEGGIVHPDITHGALQGKVTAANVVEDTDMHVAAVAGVIVGDHPSFPYYRGIAYGNNSLVSAKILPGSIEYMANGLNWAIDQGAFAINASFSITSTMRMQPVDRLFDYIVRLRDPTIVVAAGAISNEPRNVKSPAKAYNVITVGAFDDHNNPNWSNDTVAPNSCYVDPYIDGQNTSGDREKPEVLAVGVDVATVDIDLGDNGFQDQDGTSVAAPQVTALAAILMERYFYLRTNPEVIKAIIMASAVNDVDYESGPLGDKDGAGGIDVSYALSVFQNGGWDYNIIHDITDPTDLSNPFDGPGSYYDFSGSGDFEVGGTWANAGEKVRAVIAWDSNPGVDFATDGNDPLSTDLNLTIIAPFGGLVATSASLHNNYEIVEFIASETGEYKMRVHLSSLDGESLNLGLGLAWVRVPAYDATYLDHNTPGTMEAGGNQTINLEVRNSGHSTWPASGDPRIRVGYRWYYGGSLVSESSSGPEILDLPFGDRVSRSVDLAVPTTPGNYQLILDLALWESGSYTWFEDLDDEPIYEPLVVDVTVVDTTPPNNPGSVESPSHTVTEWSNDDAVTVNWSGASDSGSGVHGYSVFWDESSATIPDTTIDTTGGSAASPVLDDGDSHYFHVRARDSVGNWATGAVHLGPFYVDATAPSANVLSLPDYVITLSFDVEWQGSDSASGLENYDVQYKDGAGAWTNWLMGVSPSQTSATFSGENHHTYSFRCRAHDAASNEGVWSDPVQTDVRITPYLVVAPPSLFYLIDVDEPGFYTQTVTVGNEGGGILHWSAEDDQPWVELVPLSGSGQSILSVIVDSNALLTGTHTAPVTVSGTTETWWSPQIVNVTVWVGDVYRIALPLVTKDYQGVTNHFSVGEWSGECAMRLFQITNSDI